MCSGWPYRPDDPDQQDRADPASPMAHLLEKSDVAAEHVAPNERLTIDLYQREALNSRVCGSASPCNAEDARWGGPTMAAIKPAFPGHPILPTALSHSALLSVIAWGLKRRV
jgi:hypothetical protein